jgi:hypothetical protein
VRKGKQVLTMARKMKQHASGRQAVARKQVNKTMALQGRIKMVSSYGDPCNERVTG